jgi:hypothetical protein
MPDFEPENSKKCHLELARVVENAVVPSERESTVSTCGRGILLKAEEI